VRKWIGVGSMLAAAAVAAGAFGAHALRETVTPRMLEVWQTAVLYQMFHAVGLFVVALASARLRPMAARVAAVSFVVGVALFSGSLYVLVLSGVTWLGAITPLGGVAFLVGWTALAYAALRGPAEASREG
jgi:uncharacterized membrane protein YgdD (TMEM256/DUF423 family)